ncbi:MAG TPA: hypothetical protein VJG90_01305 [Candidatus Nanoarchaeia archaeon]|nr:hypothetical protein [Candidatus Nanoarchaeia archaeon]
MNEPTEIVRYVFSIQLFQHPDGHVEYETGNRNQGVLSEIIIAHLEAVLKRWKTDFYDQFERDTFGVKKG